MTDTMIGVDLAKNVFQVRRDDMLPMEALLKVVCDKRRFLDLFENFILFADTAAGSAKIFAKTHQYLGVNRAVDAVKRRESLKGKLGVFWHTQPACYAAKPARSARRRLTEYARWPCLVLGCRQRPRGSCNLLGQMQTKEIGRSPFVPIFKRLEQDRQNLLLEQDVENRAAEFLKNRTRPETDR